MEFFPRHHKRRKRRKSKSFLMSLFTPADGIMKTHVQWDDLQGSAFEAFGPDAKFGPNKHVKDVGCGNGFMSRICLVSPDWETVMEGVPEKFIVKISSQLPLIECQGFDESGHFHSEEFAKNMQDDVKRFHNHEAQLYKLLEKYDITDIPTPKVYFTREYSEGNPLKGYIIMEYITDGVPYHIHDNLKPESILQPMRSIAKLEAAAMKFSEEEKAPFQFNPFHDLRIKFFNKETMNALFTMMRSSGGEKMADKIDQVEAIVQDVIDTDLIDKLSTSLGMEKVLCHGDMWSTNLIWKKGENDVDLAAVVDFQTVHFGIPTEDIVRVMCACMSGKDRREHWEEILKAFYSYLEEELEGCNLPYTLDVLKEAYRQYFPFGAFMVVPMIGPLFQMACKSDDTEYKAKVGEVISEKVECLLEDICEFHRQNQLRKGA